jgi:hypothetical protein
VAARGRVWPSVATNLVWAGIGAQAVATLLRARRAPADAVPAEAARAEPVSAGSFAVR